MSEWVWLAEYEEGEYDDHFTMVVGVFESPEDAMIYCDVEFEIESDLWSYTDGRYDLDSGLFSVYVQGEHSWDSFSIEVYAIPVGGLGG